MLARACKRSKEHVDRGTYDWSGRTPLELRLGFETHSFSDSRCRFLHVLITWSRLMEAEVGSYSAARWKQMERIWVDSSRRCQ